MKENRLEILELKSKIDEKFSRGARAHLHWQKSEGKKGERMKKYHQRARAVWDTVRDTNMHVMTGEKGPAHISYWG